MKSDVNAVLTLIGELTIEEKKVIYKKMQGEINSNLLEIMEKVTERATAEPISLKEITDEVEIVRGQSDG